MKPSRKFPNLQYQIQLYLQENLTAYELAEREGHQEVMDAIDAHRQAIRDRMRRGAKKASTCNIL